MAIAVLDTNPALLVVSTGEVTAEASIPGGQQADAILIVEITGHTTTEGAGVVGGEADAGAAIGVIATAVAADRNAAKGVALQLGLVLLVFGILPGLKHSGQVQIGKADPSSGEAT